MEFKRKHLFGIIYYVSILYFTYLMLLITLQYIPIKLDVAFLKIKQEEIQLGYYQWAFFIHVFTSILVLIFGITQFTNYIRWKVPKLHRFLGKAYVLLILCFASPTGFVMALHANGGWSSKIAFGIMAILWFYFTLMAFQFARKRKWVLHENFMLRSYALTLSAISLRLFKWVMAHTLEWPPMDMYRVVAWAGWLVNIVIIEIYIHKKSQKNTV